jgi:hypothetical protein
MLDDLATPVENLRPRPQPLRHAIERVLVFEARDSANILRAVRAQRAGAAGFCITVIDFFQFAQFAFADRRQRLPGWAFCFASQALIFDGEVSTGASDDLQRATQIAMEMVTRYSMDEMVGLPK